MAQTASPVLIIAFVDDPPRAHRLHDYAHQAVRAGAILIAADSGGQTALEWGLQPTWLVGDMDSIDPASLKILTATPGLNVRQSPVEKDETDLELALYLALDLGARDITILGGLGGRLDHTLGNLYLLASPRLAESGVKVRFLAEHEEVLLLRGGETNELPGQVGDLLSLVPLTAAATGIHTAGLYYPLRGEALYLGPSRGISNLFTAPVARVTFAEGLILAVHTFANDP